MNKERYYYLDFVRVLACVMVIVMHSPLTPKGITHSTLEVGLGYLTAPCIGLFFMVSGALLLPIKDNAKSFLSHRLNRILGPTVFWTFFYLTVKIVDGNIGLSDLVHSIFSIPFSAQGNGILWFMYTLLGLYLLSPVISPWLQRISKRELESYLLLWLISLCYPFLRLWIDIPKENTNVLYYFSGYVGYFLLGYYVHQYYKGISWKNVAIVGIIAFIVAVVPPAYILVSHMKVAFYELFWYLSPGPAFMTLAWFILLMKIISSKASRCKSIISRISSASFGIYLVHIFIMRNILWNWSWLQSLSLPMEIVTCSLLTFAISYFVIRIMMLLPYNLSFG